MAELVRLAAFTTDPSGGNPAGVWIGEALPPPEEMQRIAAEVGYSETAFLEPSPADGPRSYRIRYFSPAAEVPFCGHATIASGVALAERCGTGPLQLETIGGLVVVDTATRDGTVAATLTSMAAHARDAGDKLVAEALAALEWREDELDPALPPAVAFAGVNHLILAAGSYERLANLDYDFERLRGIMLEADLTTLQLVWREAPDRFRARDPFPVGNVVEDPATGAAAAALGAYLRWRGELTPPARFTIRQGVEMGRPGLLEVEVPQPAGGVRVTGTAVPIDLPNTRQGLGLSP